MMLIFEMFGWGNKPKRLPFSAKKTLIELLFDDSKNENFQELFCLIFLIFDRLWFGNNAMIMDFQKIYQLTFEKSAELLSQISTKEDVQNYLAMYS